MHLLNILLAGVLALAVPAVARAQSVDVAPFVAEHSVKDLRISPTGEYFAASVPIEGQGQTGLLIYRRSDMKPTATLRFRRDTHVHRIWWVNPTRVVLSVADTFGSRDEPLPTGELYGIDADGGRKELLVGWRVQEEKTGTRIRSGKKEEEVAAFLVDTLPADNDHVLIKVQPFTRDPYTRLEKMNVYTGKRTPVARLPVPYADYHVDGKGQVRFADATGAGNYSQLHYRASDTAEWTLVNNERDSGRVEIPLGFSADDAIAYLRVSQSTGPSAIVALDVASGKRTELVRDPLLDPQPLYRTGCGGCKVPIGAYFLTHGPKLAFFDETSADARLHRSLEKAFPGHRVWIGSSSDDGRYKVLEVESALDPGNFFLFDTVGKSASLILHRSRGIDPALMSPVRPITFKARDGLELHGYLTVPASSSGKQLPLVVMPHGGPFGVFDDWSFNADTQLLAKAGYAVLQVNYRGSGNYGRAFRQAGAREWGGAMQDDVTDATRWAIGQGIADPARVCIYGASYGAYAALMGVAREPDLYRCAAGYVGVYDLPTMRKEERFGSRATRTWMDEWVGDDDARLAANSPNRLASRIRAPVFLAAGGDDLVAPIEHSKLMERALKAANVPVETLYYPGEGHGFYTAAHRREFYQRLLAFLGKHLEPAGTGRQGSH